MSQHPPIPPLPKDAPQSGELYRHYKGGVYEVVLLAINTVDSAWTVVYKPTYPNPGADYFTRPLEEWHEVVKYNDKLVKRFTNNEKLLYYT
ncbi:MAG: DUF1653 domain-containing protein [Patescibacteria group bacterium]